MGTDNINFYILKKVLNKEVINEALIDLIIVQNLPFQAIKWRKFYIFSKAFNPHLGSVITLSYTVVAKIINNLFQLKIDIV